MRILVLSGGGVKGAFQVGVLKAHMLNIKSPYNAIFGVSTGALTGAVMAQGSTHEEQYARLKEVEELYLNIKGNSSIVKQSSTLVGKLWDLLRHGGLMDPSPLVALVHKHVDPRKIARSETHFAAGYVDLASGDYMLGCDYEAILASAYQPFFFQLRRPWADGGLRMMTPIGDAIEYYKQSGDKMHLIVDVILCNPAGYLPYKAINHKDPTAILARTFEIIMHEMFLKDIKQAISRNSQGFVDDVHVELCVFHPGHNLGNGLEFDPVRIRDMIQHGVFAGRRATNNTELRNIL